MKFPQNTLDAIIDSERAMVLSASQRYGENYDTARDSAMLMGSFLKSIDTDRWIFSCFLADAKKHVTLALFSVVRLHRVQAMMDLRQALEDGAFAAFAIANPDPSHFVDVAEQGFLNLSKKLASKRYKWLERNYPEAAEAIQGRKNSINSIEAHADLVNAFNMSRADEGIRAYLTPFFDPETEHHVKTSLWRVADVALALMHVFYEVNERRNVIKFADNFWPRIQALGERNEALRQAILAEIDMKSG